MRKLKCLGVIPARGFSSAIPGKNLKSLKEKPLISYTIKAALKSNYLDRVIVSTEDAKIARVAKTYGAEVPFLRPKRLAGKNMPTWPVIKHAIDYVEKREKWFPDIIATLWCTTPFRGTKDIDLACKRLISSKADTIVGICKIEDKHPYWMKKIEDNKVIPFIETHYSVVRRQNLPELFMMNGAFTIRKRHVYEWLEKGAKEYKSEKTIAFIMGPIKSIDINTQLDFILAETVLEKGLVI